MTFTRDTVDNDGAQCSFGRLFKGARQRNVRPVLYCASLYFPASFSSITGLGSPELVYFPRFMKDNRIYVHSASRPSILGRARRADFLRTHRVPVSTRCTRSKVRHQWRRLRIYRRRRATLDRVAVVVVVVRVRGRRRKSLRADRRIKGWSWLELTSGVQKGND